MTASAALTTATTTTLPWMRGVSFSPATVGSGATSTGTVTLSAAAPATGATVSLTTNKATIAKIPASVLVPAGQTTGTFPIQIGSVTANTYVTISAAYNNTYAGAYLMATPGVVNPPPPPPPPTGSTVTIAISPSSTTVVSGSTKQFFSGVSGTTNTAVTWKASAGTITTGGLFTAPVVTAQTMLTVSVTSQADPTKTVSALVTVTPSTVTPPPPTGTGTYSGSGPVASWKAYQYRDTDGLYHQAIRISGATATHPVIGYSYTDSACTHLGDKFNDWWQPLGNGLWWFINFPDYVHVKWVWYDNATNKNILQQTPCIDYSGAPKYN